ncbi:MAG: NUDIX hydrolase [Promethearchaeota archaeon]
MSPLNLIYDEAEIKNKLFHCDSPNRISLNDDLFIKSAVLFPIVPLDNHSFKIIVIHRTNRGSKHRGEMSFPGGKFDAAKDKTLKDTALRECEEEIGVPRSKVKILGCLHDFPTLTKFIITPFIGIIDKNQDLIRDQREVQAILKIPINFFLNKKNFYEKVFEIEGNKFPIFYFNYFDSRTNKKYTIWGATGYMIATFLELVYDIRLSSLSIKRFEMDKIKSLKNFLKYRKEITNNF